MENNEITGLVKQTPQILATIYSDLAQPSVKKVGIALETVFEFSTSFLLPLKLLNEKIKLNFTKSLNDYKQKIENIPNEKLCEVNPQIGTPILERLTYTTNDEISELFTNLLAKASSIDTANLAHPSFVQLIERLSVDEARIIKYLLGKDFIPYVTYRAHLNDNMGFSEIAKKITMIPQEVELIFSTNIATYLDNLSSMGILDASHGLQKMDENIYTPLFEKYMYNDINNALVNSGKYREVEKVKGFFQITDFGKSFIKACNLVIPNVP